MKKVNLADRAGNKVVRRVGFSFGYLFLGPVYLLIRLRGEGLLLLLAYYYFLPIPGMEYLVSALDSTALDRNFLKILTDSLMYFRLGFDQPRVYFSIAAVALFHIFFSFICDNWILGKRIKRKNLAPVSEDDGRLLIYAHSVKPDVLLAKEISEKEHLFEQAERVWEDKNLSYTTMLSRSEIERIQDEAVKSDSAKPDQDEKRIQRHLDNASLLAKGAISKEEYDILEKRK